MVVPAGIVSPHSAFVLTFLNIPENVPDIPDTLGGSTRWDRVTAFGFCSHIPDHSVTTARIFLFIQTRWQCLLNVTTIHSLEQSAYGICYAQDLLE